MSKIIRFPPGIFDFDEAFFSATWKLDLFTYVMGLGLCGSCPLSEIEYIRVSIHQMANSKV